MTIGQAPEPRPRPDGLRIIVTVKQVPDPSFGIGRSTIDPATWSVAFPPGHAFVMNGYDENALEVALRLRERGGGSITALTLGGEPTTAVLRRALALGADAALRIDDPALAGGDTNMTARALAAAVRDLGGCDLLLCGRTASDDGHGQVPAALAEALGLPFLSPVTEIDVTGRHARVRRIVEDGYQVLELDLPGVLAVSNEGNQARQPTVRAVIAARRAPIVVRTGAELGLGGLVARRELRRLSLERREARAEIVGADSPAEAGARLADRLRAAHLV